MDVWGCHPGAPWAIPLLLGWKVIHAPSLLAAIQGRFGFLAKGAQTRGGLLRLPSQPPTQVLPLPARPEAPTPQPLSQQPASRACLGLASARGPQMHLEGVWGAGGGPGARQARKEPPRAAPIKAASDRRAWSARAPRRQRRAVQALHPSTGAAAPRAQVPAIASREGRLRPHR